MSRFSCSSSELRLPGLMPEARAPLLVAMVGALGVHLGLTQWSGPSVERHAARPLTTKFVKRQPRLTKPLELKKRPRPRRRALQRKMVAVRARADLRQAPADISTPSMLQGLTQPIPKLARTTYLSSVAVEPATLAQVVEAKQEAKDVVDMSLEMLDVDALDTGKYHALVIQDPQDRRGIKGFCHLAVVYSRSLYPPPGTSGLDPVDSIERYFLPGLLRIPTAMNEYTDIRTDILGRLSLDDVEIFKAPWIVFFGQWHSFKRTPTELEVVGRYLMLGGFVFADCQNFKIHKMPGPDYISLRNALIEGAATQGLKASFEKLPNSHPIYHCYFDFDGPPVAGDGKDKSLGYDVEIARHTEGLEIEGRLVTLLTGKGYGFAWSFFGRGPQTEWNPGRPLQFAVNTIMFALTQEGSITSRMMDRVRY